MKEKKDFELKIGELTQREEFGRGIVRIDSRTMQDLGMREGDIVELEGARKTGAIAVRSYPADAGLNVARMDGLVRRNVGAGVGDIVKLRKADVKEAKKVTLAPAQEGIIVQISPNIVKQNIYYRPVAKGDIIVPSPVVKGKEDRAPSMFQDFFGFDFEDFFFTPTGETRFVVTNTDPGGIVRITDMTHVEILSQLPKGFELEQRAVPSVTYEDIGGMHEEIRKVREMIELPLRHPELFTRLGIEPPKGVLLYGPPGCGKTLLARAVANESGANFYSIAGPEVMSMWYGKSEENLRKIFEDAEKNSPAIVFIDEIDSIAPKREEVHGEVERRVVSQLLTLMDGLKARGKVIVIAATNVPNIIDPALRRPGRFDREIEIGIPDRKGRKEILEIHTRHMPLAKDVNLDEIADITYGYTGADITALTKEAAMHALRRLLPKIKWKEEETVPTEVLEKLSVIKGDFDYAMRIVEPSAMREVLIETPNVHWDDIGGLERVKEDLKESIEWPLTMPDSFKRMGITPPKGILLYGPPGCGKTLMARAVATESNANFISVKGPELFCLSGDTSIFTDFCGKISINDFYEKIIHFSDIEHVDNHVEVRRVKIPIHTFGVDKNGNIKLTSIKRVHKLFVPDTYKFSFSNNSEITVSSRQPFLTLMGDKIGWKKTEELEVGDLVATPTKIGAFSKDITLELPEYKHLRLVKEDDDFYYVRIFSTKTITKLPKKITNEFAEFLGWFVAEGNISKEGITLCNKNEENKRRFIDLFELFVERDRISQHDIRTIVYSTPLAKFLENIFKMRLQGKKCDRISIPSIIFKSSMEIITSFLRGAYKGDGYINDEKVEYATKSKELAKGMGYLLTILGIRNKFWIRKDNTFLITISGKLDINRFKNLVLNEQTNNFKRKYYNAQHLIPDVSNLLRIAKKTLKMHYGKEIPEGLIEGIINKRKRCGLFRLRRIMKYIDEYATEKFRKSYVYKTLKIIANGDLSWVKIKKLKKTEPQIMFDLETENGSFIGGELPLILHNSKWVGESEKKVRELFRRAKQVAPSIIFFDEIDAMVPRRGLGFGEQVTEKIVSQMLTELSGLEELHDVVVIAATNRPDMLDAAILRPGRFDRQILVPEPDEKARLKILEIKTKNMPLKGVDLKKIAKITEDFSGADLDNLAREAAMYALRENKKAKEITMKHFDKALKEVKPSLSKKIVDFYRQFDERFKKKVITEKKTVEEKELGYVG